MKHTPGPWLVAEGSLTVYALTPYLGSRPAPGFEKVNRFYLQVQGGGEESALPDELMANARLIASSPDLLAALKEILTHAVPMGSDRGNSTIERIARESIERAEGNA